MISRLEISVELLIVESKQETPQATKLAVIHQKHGPLQWIEGRIREWVVCRTAVAAVAWLRESETS
jgi:hypothetical protein